MQNELTELCRDFQVCLPQTAGKLAALLKSKSLDVPNTKFVISYNLLTNLNTKEDVIVYADNLLYAKNISDFEEDYTPVFNLFELWLIAECFGFNEREFEFNSNQFITQVKNGNYLYGRAGLEYWYAEALANFLINNLPKKTF